MHMERPNGDEFVLQGTEKELDAILEKQRRDFPGTKGTKYKEGETLTLKNGTKMTVTKAGLLVKQEAKKKAKNRKKNKAAKRARRKTK